MSWLRPPLSVPPFSPASIPGLKIWLKADAGAGTSDGDAVGTWTDQSGTSHSFTQATSGKKPTYKVNIRNGLPVVRFDGSDDQLDGGDLSASFPSAGSVFAAVKDSGSNGNGGSGKVMVYQTKDNDPWWSFGGAGYWGAFRSTRLSNTPSSGIATATTWHIWSQTGDGSAYKVWVDGTNKINAGSYTHDGGNNHVIGKQVFNTEYMAMDLGEIIVYDTALSDADREQVQIYLASRWNVDVAGLARPVTVAGSGRVPRAGGNPSAYVAAVLADNPIAYWRLGESSGTDAADYMQSGIVATYTNAPTLGDTSLIATDADTATHFDGSNDVVIITSNSQMRVTTAFTLEAWIKIDSGETRVGPILVNTYDGSTVRFALGSWNGSTHDLKPSIAFYDGTWRAAVASSNVSVNAVHHIVGTWDGTTLKIYVDGILAGSNTPGVSVPNTNTDNFYIGARWDNAGDNAHLKGTIDEVAIYGTDIGATRIAAHYTAGAGSAATASPARVAGIGAVPSVTATGNGVATPTTTVGVGAIPAATAIGDPGIAAPSTVAGVGAVPAPSVATGASGLPAVTAGVGAVLAPTGQGTALAGPSLLAAVGAVPAPTVFGVANATALPDNVISIGRVPRAHPEGQGTGGGGGTSNGATDFWTIKALG